MKVIIIFFLSIPTLVFSQSLDEVYSKFEPEKISIQYHKKQEGDEPIKKNKEGAFFLTFNYDFNDSIFVYIDGVLFNKQFYKTDRSSGITGKFLQLNFKNYKKRPRITICIPSKKIYTEILFDERFKNLKIYRTEKNHEWDVIYTNYGSNVM